MSEFDPQTVAMQVFLRLRKWGLGMGEYLAARQAIEGGFGSDPATLKQTLQLLWCHSLVQQDQFERIWQEIQKQTQETASVQKLDQDSQDQEEEGASAGDQTSVLPELPKREFPQVRPSQQLAPLPVQAPPLPLMEEDNLPDLQTYFPLSRRSMIYNWRYLRRSVANGVQDVLDIPATVERSVRQGFFLAPVYQRREQNEAKLLLLVDQNGSMMPFHRFTRDLVETVQTESSLKEENINIFYFQNIPRAYVYRNPFLTLPVAIEQILAICDQETSVLIVSDAGAARGHRELERIQATTRFLFQLRQQTNLIAWLNPMSEKRWVGSSAEIIAKLIPMFQMDHDGLSQAIVVLRGQPLHHPFSPL